MKSFMVFLEVHTWHSALDLFQDYRSEFDGS